VLVLPAAHAYPAVHSPLHVPCTRAVVFPKNPSMQTSQSTVPDVLEYLAEKCNIISTIERWER
jgi:hypothetical protein